MRAVSVLLALSLAVNVFLGGFVAGRLIGDERDGPRGRPHGHGPAMMVGGPLAEGMSEEGRARMRATFAAERSAMRERYRESQRLRAAAAAALSAEPFDRARAEAALAALQASDAAAYRKVGLLMIDTAEKLSPADRKALAAAHTIAFEKRRGMRMHRRGGPGEGDVMIAPPPGAPPPPQAEELPLDDVPPEN